MTDRSERAKVGRPRVDQRPRDREPAEEILHHAARLFTVNGFEATTTRGIAEAAGLRQGSLFHYFPRKDDILIELLDRTVGPGIDAVEFIDNLDVDAGVRLYALAWRDVHNICSGPYNLAGLSLLPHARQPQFSAYWEKRDDLRASYLRYLEEGRREKLFSYLTRDASVTLDLVFGVVEAPIVWFERGRHRQDVVATMTARTAVLSVLADPSHVDEVASRARAIPGLIDVG